MAHDPRFADLWKELSEELDLDNFKQLEDWARRVRERAQGLGLKAVPDGIISGFKLKVGTRMSPAQAVALLAL